MTNEKEQKLVDFIEDKGRVLVEAMDNLAKANETWDNFFNDMVESGEVTHDEIASLYDTNESVKEVVDQLEVSSRNLMSTMGLPDIGAMMEAMMDGMDGSLN